MNNIIRGPIPLDDADQGEYEGQYEHGRDEEGHEEDEECGNDDESQLVHDVETGDDIKLPKGGENIGKTWRLVKYWSCLC